MSVNYADIIDVQALVPQRVIEASSTPTTDQTLGFIANRAAMLNAMLSSMGISTPVDGTASPKAFGWCKAVVAYGSAADVEAAAVAIARSDQQEANRLSYLSGMWDKLTAALLDGHAELIDAASSSILGQQARTRGGFDPNVGRWVSRNDAYNPSYGPSGRWGRW